MTYPYAKNDVGMLSKVFAMPSPGLPCNTQNGPGSSDFSASPQSLSQFVESRFASSQGGCWSPALLLVVGITA